MLETSIQQPEKPQFLIADVQSLSETTAFGDMTEPVEQIASEVNPLDLREEIEGDEETTQDISSGDKPEINVEEQTIENRAVPTYVSVPNSNQKEDDLKSCNKVNDEKYELNIEEGEQGLAQPQSRDNDEQDSESDHNSEDDELQEDEKRNDAKDGNQSDDCVVLSSGEEKDMEDDESIDSRDSEDDEDDDDLADYEDGEYQKNRKHPFRVGDRRDAYDDEDDDEDNRFDDEDDDDDDHFEPDSFDGASDDVLHRRSSENELNALQKERSKSLQSLEDLSDVKNRSPHKNKQSINPFHQKMKGHYNAPQNYDQMKQMFFNRLSEQKKIEEHRTEVRELENKESDKAIHFVEPTYKEHQDVRHVLENGEISLIPTNKVQKEPVDEEEMEIDVNEDSYPEQKFPEQVNKMNGNVLKDDLKQSDDSNDNKDKAPTGTYNGQKEVMVKESISYEEYLKGQDKTGNSKKHEQEKPDVVAQGQTVDKAQYESLRAAYHRVLSENMALRQETVNIQRSYEENMRIELDKSRKTVSQNHHLKQEIENLKLVIREFERGPNTQTKASQTDEVSKNLSRAFVTSSKILQTLASITNNSDSDWSQKVEAIPGTEVVDASSKNDYERSGSMKRKAEDLPEQSTSSKVPRRETQDKIKVIKYPEDEEGNQQGFLIRAEEISDNPSSSGKKCGPFMLGNVEVYMSEVNGTINIWGKEVQETPQNIAESSKFFQSTPRAQAFGAEKSQVLQKMLRDDWRYHSLSSRRLNLEYESSSCSRMKHSQSVTCKERHEESRQSKCCGHQQESRRLSLPSMRQEKCCCSGKSSKTHRHSYHNSEDEDYSDQDEGMMPPPHSHSYKRRSHTSCGAHSMNLCQNEEDRRLAANISEMQKRPLSGGTKVRNLMLDLLKGCQTAPSTSKNSAYRPAAKQQQTKPYYSNEVGSAQNYKKCVAECDNENDEATQVGALFECFDNGIEKFKTSSNNHREILNTFFGKKKS